MYKERKPQDTQKKTININDKIKKLKLNDKKKLKLTTRDFNRANIKILQKGKLLKGTESLNKDNTQSGK